MRQSQFHRRVNCVDSERGRRQPLRQRNLAEIGHQFCDVLQTEGQVQRPGDLRHQAAEGMEYENCRLKAHACRPRCSIQR